MLEGTDGILRFGNLVGAASFLQSRRHIADIIPAKKTPLAAVPIIRFPVGVHVHPVSMVVHLLLIVIGNVVGEGEAGQNLLLFVKGTFASHNAAVFQ
ncbi:hypothetical protein D3C71_1837080 [compost metagenome]